MKFSWGNFKKPLDPIEITALVIFVLYLVFPVNTPPQLAKIITTSIGLLILLGVAVYLFLNTHPAVAILYIFVVYELIRRSNKANSMTTVGTKSPMFDASVSNSHNLDLNLFDSSDTNDVFFEDSDDSYGISNLYNSDSHDIGSSYANDLSGYDSNVFESDFDSDQHLDMTNINEPDVYEQQPIPKLDHNYAPIGENSKVLSNEHAAELARLNPPSPYGNTLEEDVIRERDPEAASRMHTTSFIMGSTSFVPVYDRGSSGTFDL